MIILGTNSIKDTGYDVANSLRFNSGSSDHLTRSLGASETSTTKGTFSFWVKRGQLTTAQHIYANEVANDNNRGRFLFESNDTFEIRDTVNGSSTTLYKTAQLFRDVGAWYHMVVALDSTQAGGNRIRVYKNGTRIPDAQFGTSTEPNQNSNFNILIGGQTNKNHIGKVHGGSDYFDGYLAEFVYCDGQVLDATSFGEFDEDSGIWKPIDVSGLTFGNNGFYLDFENSGALGADVSGNSNNFTVNNLTAIDQSTDTCTTNFATLNPLATNSNVTLSEGNLKASSSFTSDNIPSYGTIGVTTGKWYWEVKLSTATFQSGAGLAGVLGGTDINFSTGYRAGLAGIQIMTTTNGTIQNDNSNSSNYFSSSIDNGDILGVALDATNKQLKFNLNGGSFGSNLNFNSAYTLFIPATDVRASSGTPAVEFNFGSPSFAISSGNTDGNGYGNFEYAVPSGYYSLNTKNLSEFG